MHSEVSIIDALFQLTIFSLLVLKISQLFKCYVIPYLLDEIKLEKTVRIELIEKDNFIKSTQNKVENQIKNQKKLFLDVEKNVQKWHTFLKDECDKAEKQSLDTKLKIENKRKIQRKNYTILKTYSQAVPKAIDSANRELSFLYSSTNGKLAFEKLIERL